MTNKMWRHDFYENFLVPTACRLRLSFHQSVVGHDGSSILAWNDLKINSSQWRYFGAIFEYEKSTSGYETVELSWTSFQFVISRSAREHHLVINDASSSIWKPTWAVWRTYNWAIWKLLKSQKLPWFIIFQNSMFLWKLFLEHSSVEQQSVFHQFPQEIQGNSEWKTEFIK